MTDEPTRIRLGGELTVRNVTGLRGDLARGLADGPRLTLEFEAVERVDLAFLQLVCSAHRAANARGGAVTFDPIELPEVVKRAVASAGFAAHLGCCDGCPWRGQLEERGP